MAKKKRNRLSISVSDVLSNRLEEHIDQTGLSASEVVRYALTEYFGRRDNYGVRG